MKLKTISENFSDDPEYKSKLEKAQKFNQWQQEHNKETLANNPKLKDKPTLLSSDDEDAAYMEPNENEITHKTDTKKTGTGKISDATKAKTQALLKKFRQQQAQKKQSGETGALDTANRTKHSGNLDAAGKLKRIVSIYKKHGKDALTSSELQTLITAIKKAKSKRQ